MVSLTQLLDVRELALVPVVVPDPAAEVRWVATSELPDPTPFLEGGELLLTTGLETRGWRSEWRGYVRRLRHTGVLAVGIGTGLTHRRPPASLVSSCRQEGVALVEVPRATSFVSISRAHVRLLEVEEQSTQRRILASQRELTSVAASGGDDEAVVATLARLLGASVTLVDPQGPSPEPDDEGLRRVRDEIERIAPLGMRASASFSGPAGSTSVQPVGLAGRPTGYLVVTVSGRPDEHARAVTATALSLLSLGAVRRSREARGDRALESAAWGLLVAGREDLAEALLTETGRRVAPSRVQVAAVETGTAPGQSLDDVWELARSRKGFWIGRRREQRLCLAWSEPVPRQLLDELEGRHCRVGISEMHEDADLAAAEAQAHQALDAATPQRSRVAWSDLAGSTALDLLDPQRAAAFSSILLGDLDADQVATLETFLLHHGSRSATADALGVHRNTVHNRIAAVERAWRRSLDDPATRVDAWLALRVRRGS